MNRFDNTELAIFAFFAFNDYLFLIICLPFRVKCCVGTVKVSPYFTIFAVYTVLSLPAVSYLYSI